MHKKQELDVNGIVVRVFKVNEEDYICLTDMLKAKDGEFFITDWLRNRNTLEYVGIWERVYNSDFNYGEFATIKSHAGLNSFKIGVNEFVQRTNAKSLVAKAGRYGGTFAHKDIAFEFAMWISPEFKIYQNLIPAAVTRAQTSIIYANEADVLNVALFGKTAQQWARENPEMKGNQRDYATINELICLSNMENINAVMINDGIPQPQRLKRLNEIAIHQMKVLADVGGRNLLQ